MRTKTIDTLIERYGKEENLPDDIEALQDLIMLLAFHTRRCQEENNTLRWLKTLMNSEPKKDKIMRIANDAPLS